MGVGKAISISDTMLFMYALHVSIFLSMSLASCILAAIPKLLTIREDIDTTKLAPCMAAKIGTLSTDTYCRTFVVYVKSSKELIRYYTSVLQMGACQHQGNWQREARVPRGRCDDTIEKATWETDGSENLRIQGQKVIDTRDIKTVYFHGNNCGKM